MFLFSLGFFILIKVAFIERECMICRDIDLGLRATYYFVLSNQGWQFVGLLLPTSGFVASARRNSRFATVAPHI